MSFLCRKTRKVKGRTRESSGYEARTRSRTIHSLYAKLFFLTACTYAEPLHTMRSCGTARVYVLSLRPVRAISGPRAVISSPVGRVRIISYHIISDNSSTSKYNSSTHWQHITAPLHGGVSARLLLSKYRDELWPTGFSRRGTRDRHNGQEGQGMT